MMNPSFSREEKLFVLAEMIKASRIDIDSLIRFINHHNIEPDWMSMQIPLGTSFTTALRSLSLYLLTVPVTFDPVVDG
jgi:hypothetical protein